jgi:nitric oxide reductase large subunit
MIGGFTILIFLAVRAYTDAPPIPDQVVDPHGRVLFTGEDIRGGQEVFLKYGLMENGTIWGHGAYLGPDFSAEYLRALGRDVAAWIARARFGRELDALTEAERDVVQAEVRRLLKQNRYDPKRRVLVFTEPEALSYHEQIKRWAEYFSHPTRNLGLPATYIRDPEELRRLTAFFAWTAWASVEPLIRVSFWGLNFGLALMVVLNLFPGGVLQLLDVLRHGYAHARSLEFLQQPVMRRIEWMRLPADLIFIGVGVVPLVLAALRTIRLGRQPITSGAKEWIGVSSRVGCD